MNHYTMPQTIDMGDLRLVLHMQTQPVSRLTVNEEDWADMGLPCRVTTPDGVSCEVRIGPDTPSGQIWVYYHPEVTIPAGAIERACRGLRERIRRWKNR